MDFIDVTIKQPTKTMSVSFGLNYCFCGNQDFEYAYYHLKAQAYDFFSYVITSWIKV